MAPNEIHARSLRSDTESEQLSPRNELIAARTRARHDRVPQHRLPVRGPERGDRRIAAQLAVRLVLGRRRCAAGETIHREARIRRGSCGRGLWIEAQALDLITIDVVPAEVDPATARVDAGMCGACTHIAQQQRRSRLARLRVDGCAEDVRNARPVRSPDQIPPVGAPIRSHVQSTIGGDSMHQSPLPIENHDVVVPASRPARSRDPSPIWGHARKRPLHARRRGPYGGQCPGLQVDGHQPRRAATSVHSHGPIARRTDGRITQSRPSRDPAHRAVPSRHEQVAVRPVEVRILELRKDHPPIRRPIERRQAVRAGQSPSRRPREARHEQLSIRLSVRPNVE